MVMMMMMVVGIIEKIVTVNMWMEENAKSSGIRHKRPQVDLVVLMIIKVLALADMN